MLCISACLAYMYIFPLAGPAMLYDYRYMFGVQDSHGMYVGCVQ